MPVWIKWAIAAALSAVAAVGIQFELASLPKRELDVNMLFVPPPQLTRHLASGYQNLAADGLWLGLLQYYGDRVVWDRNHMVNLAPMFDLITDLDPQFWFAYWLGAWALGDNREPAKAVALLQKGERKNPGDFNYPYLQGFVQFLFNKDYHTAGECFTRAAGMHDAPRFARTMAARMFEHQGKEDLALQIWQNLYQNAKDTNTRQIAKRNVERILAEMAGKHPKAFKVKP